MSEATTLPVPEMATSLPTHLDLPDTDGVPMMNGQQPPQSRLLTGCLRPRLREFRPDGQFLIGDDLGIYWEVRSEEVLRGCRCPDFTVVLGVPPLLDGGFRRSYVLWQEHIRPTLLIEYVSGDGAEERDRTPRTGKFWVYEQRVQATFYAIFDCFEATLEVYLLTPQGYNLTTPNRHGRYRIDPLGIELGLWHGVHEDTNTLWVRVWDATTGELVPTTEEVAELNARQAEAESKRAEAASKRAEVASKRAEVASKQAETESKRAETAEQQNRLLLERLRAAGLEPPDSGPEGGD